MAIPTSATDKPALVLITELRVSVCHDMHITPNGTGRANPPNDMKPALKALSRALAPNHILGMINNHPSLGACGADYKAEEESRMRKHTSTLFGVHPEIATCVRLIELTQISINPQNTSGITQDDVFALLMEPTVPLIIIDRSLGSHGQERTYRENFSRQLGVGKCLHLLHIHEEVPGPQTLHTVLELLK